MGVGRSREKAMRRIRQETAKYAPAKMLVAIHVRREDEVSDFAQAVAEHLDFAFERVLIAEAGLALSCHGCSNCAAGGLIIASFQSAMGSLAPFTGATWRSIPPCDQRESQKRSGTGRIASARSRERHTAG